MISKTTTDQSYDDLSREASAWLVRLEDDRDNETLRLEFMDWLAASPTHLAAWEETQHVANVIAAAGAPDRQKSGFSAWFRIPLRGFSPVRALAPLALAACLAWVIVPDLALQLQADAITGTAELRAVELEDGITVTLAPDTAIAFANGARVRQLDLLQGQAFFNVTHDTARPFRIKAGDSTITVLGTAFAVRITEGGTEVAVQRGKVAVTAPAHSWSERIELVAGQTISVAGGRTVLRGAMNPTRIASWRTGEAIVNDRSVANVIDRIRPWYSGYIIARGPGLTTRHVSGIYDLHQPDQALEALTRAHYISVSRMSPWMRIVTVN